MPSIEVLVVLVLATFRLTRLVTADTISVPFRDLLFRFAWRLVLVPDSEPADGEPLQPEYEVRAPWRTWLFELFDCSWCFGVWASGIVFVLWKVGGPVAFGALVIAAVAGGQALCSVAAARLER